MTDSQHKPDTQPPLSGEPAHHPHKGWVKWLAILMFFVVLIYDLGELVHIIREHEAAGSDSMFAIPEELSYHYDHCDYQLLFICGEVHTHEVVANLPGCDRTDPLTRAACVTTVEDRHYNFITDPAAAWRSWPLVGIVGTAILTAPRVPGALLYMLGKRWGESHLDFALGVFFTLAWITLIVLALRAKEHAFLWLSLMVVVGPYIITAIFWMLQHAFDGAAGLVQGIAGAIVSAIGIPGCVTVCCAHDFKEVAEIFKVGRHIPKG
jgi:hypothetical protein